MEKKMKSKVYFLKVENGESVASLAQKTGQLFDFAGFKDAISKKDMVAVKTSFGEKGNIGYLKPPIIKAVVDKVKECNGKPFLIETNTLYEGRRTNAVDHLSHAHDHGFSYENIGAPIIIGDGLFGEHDVQIEINQELVKNAFVAGAATAANTTPSISPITRSPSPRRARSPPPPHSTGDPPSLPPVPLQKEKKKWWRPPPGPPPPQRHF